MSSDLKRLSNFFIILTIISCIFSYIAWKNYYIHQLDLRGMGFACIYLAIAPPVIFISTAVIIRKIAEQISIVDKHLRDRLKELEDQLKNQTTE